MDISAFYLYKLVRDFTKTLLVHFLKYLKYPF
ncbi:hypothetical protein DYZ89_00582 [Listeria monocytogenes]|uniref:Uncharacterized protein n=1 Tax=Listeria monocytogenes TaxID=1639 RepID=A0AB37NLA0_LISMN|nr:hypothetical protein M637_07965 [Listeria monocytogenes]ERH80099.1 hypothetical protein O171_14170 [Listeria monocytogenes serotype 4bV str. LS645]ERH80259.1 hypothetical protein O167_14175 [Listeria monocytogenes serotype 4bV str. LS642]ERH82558.1 hypothetical protein O174_12745 [Listeria monocytogenes serotype 4bV str. LS644]ERH85972.1 hypothetical protein N895_14540 [Listeria monocytogenes serotype 4bV str. LS542]ERH86918.1 hypothetical protein O168_14110 [Listeria monocytogenes serotype